MTNRPKELQDHNPTILRDLVATHLDVLFCGINPALSAARSGHHFSNPSNRFWKVLHKSGFTPYVIRPEQDVSILSYGCGLTAAAERPTVRASEVSGDEFHASADVLEAKVRDCSPRFLAFLGKPAFAALARKRVVSWGEQPAMWSTRIWVLPNPSGLNRAFSFDELVGAYSMLRVATRQGRS